MMGANTTAALLAFGAILLVARGLSTAEFGIFTTLTVFMTMTAAVGDVGIGAGLMRFVPDSVARGDKRAAGEYLWAASWCVVGLAVVLGGGVVVGAPILRWVIFPNVSLGLLRIVGVGVGLTLVYGFLTTTLLAYQQFRKAAALTLVYGMVRMVLIGPLWLDGNLDLSQAVMIFCWSALPGVVLGWWWLPARWRWEIPGRDLLKELLGFSGWLGVNQMVAAVFSRLDMVLLNRLGGAYQAGIYGAAQRMDSFFVLLVNSLAGVFAPRLVQLREERQQRAFVKKMGLVAGGVIVAMVGLVVLAPWVMRILFGVKYMEGVMAFQVLTVGMMLFVATIPVVLPLIYVLKRTRTVAMLSLVQLGVILGVNTWLIPVWGSVAPAVAWGMAQVVVLVVGGILVGRWLVRGATGGSRQLASSE
jgi:O-antigen/teichoic acid export membrane protein